MSENFGSALSTGTDLWNEGHGGGRYRGVQQDVTLHGTNKTITTVDQAVDALHTAYTNANTAVLAMEDELYPQLDDDSKIGGAVVTALIITPDGYAVPAQTGDCSCLIVAYDEESAERDIYNLTADQRPSVPEEKEYIEAHGGDVNSWGRLNGMAANARQFGDRPLRPATTFEPDISAFNIEQLRYNTSTFQGIRDPKTGVHLVPDEEFATKTPNENIRIYGITLSDGITDPLTEDQIAAQISPDKTPQQMAEDILKAALTQAAEDLKYEHIDSDNMSVTVTEYDPEAKEAKIIANIDGHGIFGELVATTIQRSMAETFNVEKCPEISIADMAEKVNDKTRNNEPSLLGKHIERISSMLTTAATIVSKSSAEMKLRDHFNQALGAERIMHATIDNEGNLIIMAEHDVTEKDLQTLGITQTDGIEKDEGEKKNDNVLFHIPSKSVPPALAELFKQVSTATSEKPKVRLPTKAEKYEQHLLTFIKSILPKDHVKSIFTAAPEPDHEQDQPIHMLVLQPNADITKLAKVIGWNEQELDIDRQQDRIKIYLGDDDLPEKMRYSSFQSDDPEPPAQESPAPMAE